MASTDRAQAEVNIPHELSDLFVGESFKLPFKPLVALKAKNELQVSRSVSVGKDSIVTDFLKTLWKDMHKEPTNKLNAGYSDDLVLPGSVISGLK